MDFNDLSPLRRLCSVFRMVVCSYLLRVTSRPAVLLFVFARIVLLTVLVSRSGISSMPLSRACANVVELCCGGDARGASSVLLWGAASMIISDVMSLLRATSLGWRFLFSLSVDPSVASLRSSVHRSSAVCSRGEGCSIVDFSISVTPIYLGPNCLCLGVCCVICSA